MQPERTKAMPTGSTWTKVWHLPGRIFFIPCARYGSRARTSSLVYLHTTARCLPTRNRKLLRHPAQPIPSETVDILSITSLCLKSSVRIFLKDLLVTFLILSINKFTYLFFISLQKILFHYLKYLIYFHCVLSKISFNSNIYLLFFISVDEFNVEYFGIHFFGILIFFVWGVKWLKYVLFISCA